MARALREASTKIDFRSAPCAGGDSNQTPSGPGHQRGSPSRGASTARISPDAAVFGARLQRRYLEEKAASGAAASSAAANGVARDRKSTRLNSSHVSISYAVFCLKKKIEHKQE